MTGNHLEVSCVRLFATPWTIHSGQNAGVSSCSLLQGIFPAQGSNPGLPHCRRILYQLSHKGSPEILEWVAYSFSRGSSRTRDWTGVSCTAGGVFTNWVIREAPVDSIGFGHGTDRCSGAAKRAMSRMFSRCLAWTTVGWVVAQWSETGVTGGRAGWGGDG